jgi:hypothetical protein
MISTVVSLEVPLRGVKNEATFCWFYTYISLVRFAERKGAHLGIQGGRVPPQRKQVQGRLRDVDKGIREEGNQKNW